MVAIPISVPVPSFSHHPAPSTRLAAPELRVLHHTAHHLLARDAREFRRGRRRTLIGRGGVRFRLGFGEGVMEGFGGADGLGRSVEGFLAWGREALEDGVGERVVVATSGGGGEERDGAGVMAAPLEVQGAPFGLGVVEGGAGGAVVAGDVRGAVEVLLSRRFPVGEKALADRGGDGAGSRGEVGRGVDGEVCVAERGRVGVGVVFLVVAVVVGVVILSVWLMVGQGEWWDLTRRYAVAEGGSRVLRRERWCQDVAGVAENRRRGRQNPRVGHLSGCDGRLLKRGLQLVGRDVELFIHHRRQQRRRHRLRPFIRVDIRRWNGNLKWLRRPHSLGGATR